MLFYPQCCHFRQLWTQEWQKAAAPPTIKRSAEPLIVALKRGNYFHPGPLWGLEYEERGGGKKGQEGMCGWTEWQYGWQGVGRFWHSYLRTWVAG